MLFFEAVEIVRRTVWAVFRIEWEVVAKVIYPAGSYVAVGMTSATADEDDDEDEL